MSRLKIARLKCCEKVAVVKTAGLVLLLPVVGILQHIYPWKESKDILRTFQSTLHVSSLTDLFTTTPSRLLWEASSHMLQLMHKGCSYTYQPLYIARYSFIQQSELEHCIVKKLAQGFNTRAQDSNLGSLSRESKLYPWATALYG